MAVMSNRTLERKAIKFICKGASPSNKLLASLDVDCFYNKHTREAFQRIQSFAKQRNEIIGWSDLLNDPALSQDTRDTLALAKKPIAVTEKEYRGLARNLEKLKRQRILYTGAKELAETLTKGSIDEIAEADKLADLAAKIKLGTSEVKSVNIGSESTGFADSVKRILTKSMPKIRTGFDVFDSQNKGFFLGSAITLGGYTGAGKTALSDVLADNMSNYGHKVCQVSLEMNEDELITRKLARITKTSLTKLIDAPNSLTRDEKKRIYKAAMKYDRALARKDGQQNIRVPDGDVSIEEILFLLKPYGYEVIIIDYVTLLKGTDSERQWQVLGNILRFCKVFARTNNCVVIMLCQVDEEGQLRYSKAMAEHSNNCWIFQRDENFDETKLLHVKQLKARMGKQFPFDLYADLDKMTITDVPADHAEKLAKAAKAENSNKKTGVKRKEVKEDEWLKEI